MAKAVIEQISITEEEFEKFFEERVQKCRQTLIRKAKEYASDSDKMHNFNEAARMLKLKPHQIAFYYMMKHFQSVTDIILKDKDVPPEVWDEKLGDLMNYFFLIDAMWRKAHDQNRTD